MYGFRVARIIVEAQDGPNDPAVMAELRGFAEAAMASCEKWFGPRPEPHMPYELLYGPFPQSMCIRGGLPRRYLICIASARKTPEERASSVAHEIYHRCTQGRPGLRRHGWVDEMLAMHTADRFLRANGFGEYALRVRDAWWLAPKLSDWQQVYRMRRVNWLLGRYRYPQEFYAAVMCLGEGLAHLVGWKAMCRIVHCTSWEQWLQGLGEPNANSALVAEYLELPETVASIFGGTEDRTPDEDMKLARALVLKCDHSNAVHLLDSVQEARGSTDFETLAQLGLAHYQAMRYAAAEHAWRRAIHCASSEAVWLRHNLGNALRRQGRLDAAIAMWRQLLAQHPDYAPSRSALEAAEQGAEGVTERIAWR